MAPKHKHFTPVNPVYARYHVLKTRWDDRNTAITDEERVETLKLRDEWKVLQSLSIPRPTCCATAQRFPAVVWQLNARDGEDSSHADGSWCIQIPDHLAMKYATIFSAEDHGCSYFESLPAPTFCPFCATPLPAMKRVPRPDVCRTRDHNYCDNCGERLRNCECLPMEAAFEPA